MSQPIQTGMLISARVALASISASRKMRRPWRRQ
jgi:hypothetical protein